MSAVRAYAGVTDDNWYQFLAARRLMTEVNFWQPSGNGEFRVLAPGEPFFFKTHYPHNKVVGGGFFSDSARLRVSEAWEFFGVANGVSSMEEMCARIGRYRRVPIGAGEDPLIGCLFVRDVRLFPEDATASPPPQFARNIVQGRSYDLADPSAASYFADPLWQTGKRSARPAPLMTARLTRRSGTCWPPTPLPGGPLRWSPARPPPPAAAGTRARPGRCCWTRCSPPARRSSQPTGSGCWTATSPALTGCRRCSRSAPAC